MNRLDVILSERELQRLIAVINDCGAPGYSVARHITGRGAHGAVTGESLEITGLGANAHVIVFCDDDTAQKLQDQLKPVLKYYGGVAFLSSCQPI